MMGVIDVLDMGNVLVGERVEARSGMVDAPR